MASKPPEPFEFQKPAKWPAWRQRFLRYRLASKLDTYTWDAQVSDLIYCMGDDAEKIYYSFTIPRSPEGPAAIFDDVVKLFDAHFARQVITEDERPASYQRQQYNQPIATQPEVEQLRKKFTELCEKLDTILPRFAFARNGGVTLIFAAAVFMFVGGITLFPEGRHVAALLLAFGLLLHGWFFFLREVGGIIYSRQLLNEFFRVVPRCMYTYTPVPAPKSHGVFCLLMFLVDLSAFWVCLTEVTTGTNIFLLLISIVIVCLAAIFVNITIAENNDYNFKITCLSCVKILDTLLDPCEES